jgi:UDP-N-acetylmuramoyl-L-alanyl-D-glutamate--2,6-diaminopimelate ligase
MNTARRANYGSTLGDLLVRHVDETVLAACAGIVIHGMQMDSRQVKKGDVFFALFGKNHDARDYIDLAVANGAAAVIADASGSWQGLRWVGNVPVIALPGLRAKLGEMAANFYQHPSQAMPVIGVTGTNGKTSCTQFIAQMLNHLGQSCGVVGTLGCGVYPDLKDTGFTTPDPLLLQAALADLRDQRIAAIAMEASSQGLHQHRLQAVEFHTAVFTNLTRDHLDYHGTMQAYAESKRRLFENSGLKVGVVNMDDDHAVVMLNALPRCARSFTFSISSQLADVHARKVDYRVDGFDLELCTPWGEGVIWAHLTSAICWLRLQH